MDTEKLIAEVAKRHQALVSASDPIFIAVTLNELVVAEYVQEVQVAVERAQEAMAITSAQQLESAKRIASQLVTSVGAYVGEQVRAAGQAVRTEFEEMVKTQRVAAEKVVEEARGERRAARRAAIWAMVCAGAVVGMVVGMWLAK